MGTQDLAAHVISILKQYFVAAASPFVLFAILFIIIASEMEFTSFSAGPRRRDSLSRLPFSLWPLSL